MPYAKLDAQWYVQLFFPYVKYPGLDIYIKMFQNIRKKKVQKDSLFHSVAETVIAFPNICSFFL